MSLRSLHAHELRALEARVDRAWTGLRAHGMPGGLSEAVTLPVLVPGFGDWVRAAPPVSEPFRQATSVVFRCPPTDEFTVLSVPVQATVGGVREQGREVLLAAGRGAVGGTI